MGGFFCYICYMRYLFLLFVVYFINQAQTSFAQDSILTSCHIIKLITSVSHPHYKFQADISTEHYPKDSCENLSISFQKEPNPKDTFIVHVPQGDSSKFTAKISPITENEITGSDTFSNRIETIDIYELEEQSNTPNKREQLVKVEIYYNFSKFNKNPKVYYLISLPPIRNYRCRQIKEVENYRKIYTPTELILRTAPGVPR